MASNTADDILAWAREVRGEEHLQADPAILEQIMEFMQTHEAETTRVATHCVLENYPDWWAKGRRAPPGLEISRQEDLEELYRHAGKLFGLGIPLTLAEKRTPSFRFFQDVEAWGSRENCMSVGELISPESPLLRLIGTVLAEVFPGHGGFLDTAVYDATGLSQTKGVKKTSLRLVWPGIVVDSDRAARVRDLVVHRLASESGDGVLSEVESQLKEHSSVNAWHNVFGDAAYAGRSNVRMPLSDRVSPLPLRAPERRPLAPVGVLRLSFVGESKIQKMEWLCQKGELENSEWIKIGCLRQNEDVELTEWTVPSFPGNQPIPTSTTRTGRVKVRTAAGSDGGGGLRLRTAKVAPSTERAGQLLTVERRFSCEPDEFSLKMEPHLGRPMLEPDGSCVWQQPGGDARIVMHSEDKRVKIIGRPNQVRSLVVIVAPFTEAQPTLGAATRPQSGPQMPDGRMPSDAFAPIGNDGYPETAGQTSEVAAPVELVGRLRLAKEDFEAQGQGELSFLQGESIRVTSDPEGESGGSADRWVYGSSEDTQQVGWFPLSHTVFAEDVTEEVEGEAQPEEAEQTQQVSVQAN